MCMEYSPIFISPWGSRYLGCPFVQEMEDEGVKHICFENETPVF